MWAGSYPQNSYPQNNNNLHLRKLFITGLPSTCDDDQLFAVFSRFGPLVEWTIPKATKKPKKGKTTKATGRGFGFVTFQNVVHADMAVRANGMILDKKSLIIQRAQPGSEDNKQPEKIPALEFDAPNDLTVFIKPAPNRNSKVCRKFEELRSHISIDITGEYMSIKFPNNPNYLFGVKTLKQLLHCEPETQIGSRAELDPPTSRLFVNKSCTAHDVLEILRCLDDTGVPCSAVNALPVSQCV